MEAALFLAAIVLGIVFLLLFRPQIARLLSRVRIERGRITLGADQTDSPTGRDPRAEAESLMRAMDNQMLVEQEETIRRELRERNLENRTEAIPVLIRSLAAMQIAYAFEEFYRTIYGSQLRLLEFLNTCSGGVPREVARAFHTAVASQHPRIYDGWSFEGWLRWPAQAALVREQNGNLSITIRGREFLAYLTRLGLGRNLPF